MLPPLLAVGALIGFLYIADSAHAPAAPAAPRSLPLTNRVRRRRRAHDRIAGFGIEKAFIRQVVATLLTDMRHPDPPRLEFSTREDAAYYFDEHVVIVNPAWVRAMLRAFCDDSMCSTAFVVGVLAHELRHSMQVRFVDTPQNRWRAEYDADAAAVWAIMRYDLDLAHFQRIMGRIAARGGPTHPPGWARVRAMTNIYLQIREA